MKKLVLLLLLFATNVVIGQTIKSTSVDKFDGIKTIATTEEGIVSSFGISQVSAQGMVFVDSAHQQKTSALYFTFRATQIGSLSKNKSNVILLLDNGVPLELKYSGDYKLFGSGDLIVFFADVSEETLNTMSQHEVTDIRITSSYTYDYKIKSKQRSKLSNIAKLLLDQIK